MMNAEQCQIGFDEVHHLLDRFRAENGQPLFLWQILESIAQFAGEIGANRFQILARIQPFRDFADIVTQRFAITQVRRSCEHINLSASIVDVILAGYIVTGELKQCSQCIANHGPAAVTHMHGSRGIC